MFNILGWIWIFRVFQDDGLRQTITLGIFWVGLAAILGAPVPILGLRSFKKRPYLLKSTSSSPVMDARSFK